MRVEKNMVVGLRYIMKNCRGEILENNMDAAPVEYLHGAGAILPELERQLQGLIEGSRKKISLPASPQPDSLELDVWIYALRTASEEEIRNGKPQQPGRAPQDCGPDCCC